MSGQNFNLLPIGLNEKKTRAEIKWVNFSKKKKRKEKKRKKSLKLFEKKNL